LPGCIEEPSPKHEITEALVFETYPVKIWFLEELCLRILPIKCAKPADRHTCEQHIV